jgi:hypothetical protein
MSSCPLPSSSAASGVHIPGIGSLGADAVVNNAAKITNTAADAAGNFVDNFLGGGGKTKTSAFFSSVNDIASSSFTKIQSTCDGNTTVEQSFGVSSSRHGGNDLFSQNAGCVAATAAFTTLTSAREKLLQAAANDYAFVPKGMEGFTQPGRQAAFHAQDWIGFACRSVTVKNVSQRAKVNFRQDCQFTSSDSEQLANSMATQLQQNLQNHKDVFGQLGGLLSGGSSSCIQEDFRNKARTSFNADILNQLKVQIDIWQSFQVASGSESVWVDGVTETLNSSTMTSLMAKVRQSNSAYTSEEQKAAQTLIDKNATISDIGNALGGALVGGANFLASQFGQILLIMAVVCIVMVVVMGAMAWANPDKAKEVWSNNAPASVR